MDIVDANAGRAGEDPAGGRPIAGVPTSITAFVGRTSSGAAAQVGEVRSFGEFEGAYGGLNDVNDFPLTYAVRDFFLNGGSHALIVRREGERLGPDDLRGGLRLLEAVDLFNLLYIPPDRAGGVEDVRLEVYAEALDLCVVRRAMLILDPPVTWTKETLLANPAAALAALGLAAPATRNAALYFPYLLQPGLAGPGLAVKAPPGGSVAGVIARNDAARGVWKAPAGREALIEGATGLAEALTDAEVAVLNPLGINCLRVFPGIGTVIWGARTLSGGDPAADEYKYIPVRRLALYIEESLHRGLGWVANEPNDEPLWAAIRLRVGEFMHNLCRQGALQGQTPREAYFVKCDRDTMTQGDIDNGVVNCLVGFAPLKPAEFVIIRVQVEQL